VAAQEQTRPWVSGAILAAGTSTRMGRSKQLLPLGGKPVIQHVVDAATRSAVDEILVVVGHDADAVMLAVQLPPRGRYVVNPGYAEGMASSLAAAVRAAGPRSQAIAVLLGDEPSISTDVIDAALAAFRSGTSRIVRAVYVASDGTRKPGHPVIIGRDAWAEVERLRGDEGMRRVIAAHPEWIVEVDISSQAPADLDTWDEYLRATEAEGEAPL
jgi:molybdenum cofactor cytidylyltransferase